MSEIPLTHNKIALIDDADFLRVSKLRWIAWKSPQSRTWYAVNRSRRAERIYLHRFVLTAASGVCVDHVNGNGLDCRRGNLRIATSGQNIRNSRKSLSNTSGFKGVYFHRRDIPRPWSASIMFNRKSRHIGYFESGIDAALAYDGKARELFGEFACVNFPREGERGVND